MMSFDARCDKDGDLDHGMPRSLGVAVNLLSEQWALLTERYSGARQDLPKDSRIGTAPAHSIRGRLSCCHEARRRGTNEGVRHRERPEDFVVSDPLPPGEDVGVPHSSI